MIQTTNAVILRSSLFRETSQLLTFLTQDFGKLYALAKGVRRRLRRSSASFRFGSTFELFTHNRIVFYERGRSELQLLSQCDLLDSFPAIRSDLKKMAYALYFLELVDCATESGSKIEPIYTLLLEALRELSRQKMLEEIARIFEIKLLCLSGLMPDLSCCQKCQGPTTRHLRLSLQKGGVLCENCFGKDRAVLDLSKGTLVSMQHIATFPWELNYRMRMSRRSKEELKESLKRFMDFHLEERVCSRDFLKEVEALAF